MALEHTVSQPGCCALAHFHLREGEFKTVEELALDFGTIYKNTIHTLTTTESMSLEREFLKELGFTEVKVGSSFIHTIHANDWKKIREPFLLQEEKRWLDLGRSGRGEFKAGDIVEYSGSVKFLLLGNVRTTKRYWRTRRVIRKEGSRTEFIPYIKNNLESLNNYDEGYYFGPDNSVMMVWGGVYVGGRLKGEDF